TGDQANQNLTAILVGDISGNWTPSIPNPLQAHPEGVNTITVALPIKQDPPGGPSTIPITVSETNVPPGVFSYDFNITFDPAVLQPQATPYDTWGSVSRRGRGSNAQTYSPGGLHILGC